MAYSAGMISLSKPPLFALIVSGGLLVGAYAFQYIGGMAPCQMCYWQRWAHFAVLGFAIAGLFAPKIRVLSWLIAAALLASVLVAGFHAGVEYGWWEGPKTCTSSVGAGDLSKVDPGALFREPIKVVDCSKPAWVLLGISMAGWNALISLGALVGVLSLMKRRG